MSQNEFKRGNTVWSDTINKYGVVLEVVENRVKVKFDNIEKEKWVGKKTLRIEPV